MRTLRARADDRGFGSFYDVSPEQAAEDDRLADGIFNPPDQEETRRPPVERPLVEKPPVEKTTVVEPPPHRTSTRGSSTAGTPSTLGPTSTSGTAPTAAERLRSVQVTEDVVDFAFRHGVTDDKGRKRRLSKSEFVTWKARLAVEEGKLVPAPVSALPLPKDAPRIAQHVYERFVFLLACRWLHTSGEPAPFSRGFAAVWAGVTPDQAREAIRWLRDRGFLVIKGRTGRAYLYALGNDR
jgi:hypothetical protein